MALKSEDHMFHQRQHSFYSVRRFWIEGEIGPNLLTIHFDVLVCCNASLVPHSTISACTVSGDALHAVRAVVIFGLVSILAAIVCFCLKKFLLKDQTTLTPIASVLAIAAGNQTVEPFMKCFIIKR